MSKKRVSSVRLAVRPPPADDRPKNRLLAALPAKDFRRLRPYLKTVPIHVKQVLHTNGKPFKAVYFPNGGVVSITAGLSHRTVTEAATVGDEGMLGVEAFLCGDAVASGDALMQVPDTNAEMLDVDDFRRELAKRGAL